MTQTYKKMPIEYVDKLSSKPEDMTHLHGNMLVYKTHPQIKFRGMLDSLCANIISLQVICRQADNNNLVESLDEILIYVRKILGAEVQDVPLEDIKLFGLDSKQLRYESHHIEEIYGISHPLPSYDMGNICAKLNELRTLVRETELYALEAFKNGDKCTRADIAEALNRLSSAVYILFIRQLTGKWAIVSTSINKGIMVEASARHVHLTEEAIRILFGEPLHKKGDLSQPGQYVCEERLTIMTQKGEIERVAVLGPARKEVQVEISLTDARILGIEVPINLSGDLSGAADVILVGPKGNYNAPGSTIAAKAHIHMTPKDAEYYGVENNDEVSVKIDTDRPVTVNDVVIRVSEEFSLAMHIDFDEANACSLKTGDLGYIVKKGENMNEDLIQKITKEVMKRIQELSCSNNFQSQDDCHNENHNEHYNEHKEIITDRVLTEQKAKELILKNKTCIDICSNTIVTPAAKDVFTQNRVKLQIH